MHTYISDHGVVFRVVSTVKVDKNMWKSTVNPVYDHFYAKHPWYETIETDLETRHSHSWLAAMWTHKALCRKYRH